MNEVNAVSDAVVTSDDPALTENEAAPVRGSDTPKPRQFPCGGCGATLSYSPGTSSLTCEYCGHTQALPMLKGGTEELDFQAWLKRAEGDGELQEVAVVRCGTCGAEVEPEAGTTAMVCPFCGTGMDMHAVSQRQIKPTSLLPFTVEKRQARDKFKEWVASRWFAPSRLKSAARQETTLKGVYVPYWTFDAQTDSDYRGERGTHYQVTESYTAEEDGKTVQKTRTVTRTRWTPVSGELSHWFDDVLVVASEALPRELARKLEPWDLAELVAYDSRYVSGFNAQSYQVDLKPGFELAKKRMAPAIEDLIEDQIGGDEQRVEQVTTRYRDVTFKHLLLPIWISAYRFGDETYRFLINGRTGEVQGERPYSWVKIGLLIAAVAAVVGGIWWWVSTQQ